MAEVPRKVNTIRVQNAVMVGSLPKFEDLCEFVKNILFWSGCVFFVTILVLWLTPIGLDDTDNPTTGARSGMSLFTDHGTGCQYLRAGGNLIPRLDGNRNHKGCRL